jgi:hypothetical protein
MEYMLHKRLKRKFFDLKKDFCGAAIAKKGNDLPNSGRNYKF